MSARKLVGTYRDRIERHHAALISEFPDMRDELGKIAEQRNGWVDAYQWMAKSSNTHYYSRWLPGEFYFELRGLMRAAVMLGHLERRAVILGAPGL